MHECSPHTHTDWACSDLWLLFLTLYSQSTYMCNNTPCIVMACYATIAMVNSLYTPPHTHTHTHTQTGLVPLAETLGSYFSHCFHKVYMYMNVHTCAHTLLCTQPDTIYLSHIQHIHIQYTCIVTEMESCAQHIRTLLYSTLVRTHTNEQH